MLCVIGAFSTSAGQSDPLTFQLRDAYLVIAQGAIGPLDRLNLLIDTGAIPGMVDGRIARKLRLAIKEAEVVAFGRQSRAQLTTLPNVRVGPIRADSVLADVGDLSFLGPHVDGIVGLDLLTRSSFSIDYQQRQLTFGPVEATDPGLHLDVTPPFLTVKVELGGHPFRLLVDTGSSHLVLFERRVQGRLPALALRGDTLLYHTGGISHMRRVALPLLKAGSCTIANIEGLLSNADVTGYPDDIDGILAIRVLASMRADFDFERNRLGWK
jgi:predicted aspartyl protease